MLTFDSPSAQWILHYNVRWLIGDLIAGITVGLVLVPQAMVRPHRERPASPFVKPRCGFHLPRVLSPLPAAACWRAHLLWPCDARVRRRPT